MSEHQDDPTSTPEESPPEARRDGPKPAPAPTGPKPRPVDRSPAPSPKPVEPREEASARAKPEASPPPPPPPATGPRAKPEDSTVPRPSPRPPAVEAASTDDTTDDPVLVGSELDGSYDKVVRKVEQAVEDGYDLLGMVGLSAAGKTHALRALTYVLDGFSSEARTVLLEQLEPAATGISIHVLPYEGAGPDDPDRAMFVDAGGELFVRLQDNDWSLTDGNSALLHALDKAKGLFCMVDLHPGHFDDPGTWQGMGRSATARVKKARQAQLEQQLVDLTLLFLRALRHHRGDLEPVIQAARAAETTAEGLQPYRTLAPRLDIPVTVLFTKADELLDQDRKIGDEYLTPHTILGVAPFVHRRLPYLYNAVARQCRRFRFDFVQSYVEAEQTRFGETRVQPVWDWNDHPLSVGLLPAVELVLRQRPKEGSLARLLQLFEISTATAHRIHRRLHPELWRRGGA